MNLIELFIGSQPIYIKGGSYAKNEIKCKRSNERAN